MKDAGSGWEMHLGDCLDVVASADHLITDPPYGFGAYATDKDGGDVVERLRLYRAAGVTAVFGYPETLVAWCVELGWHPDEWITWWPTNAAAKAGGRHKGVPRQTEHIAIFGVTTGASELTSPRSFASIKKPQNVGLSPDVRIGDVWQDASPGIGFNAPLRLHPNEKPVDLLLKLVTLVSLAGETIVDPFAGSGTTGVAALRLGRKFVGVEKDPTHFATCCERLRAEETGSTLKAQRAGQLPLMGGSK